MCLAEIMRAYLGRWHSQGLLRGSDNDRINSSEAMAEQPSLAIRYTLALSVDQNSCILHVEISRGFFYSGIFYGPLHPSRLFEQFRRLGVGAYRRF